MKYVIYNKIKKGYLCDDEDHIGGWDYEEELSPYTIYFNSRETALFNCDDNEIVIEVSEPNQF